MRIDVFFRIKVRYSAYKSGINGELMNFKKTFLSNFLNKTSILPPAKFTFILFQALFITMTLATNITPVNATDFPVLEEKRIVGQSAVCKLVDGPLDKMFDDEQHNLMRYVLSKSIILTGDAPYILLEAGADGKPSHHPSICVNIKQVENIFSTKPEHPYFETKTDGLQGISDICQKESLVSAICKEVSAVNLQKRSFFVIGTPQISQVDLSGETDNEPVETIPNKPQIQETVSTTSIAKAAEPFAMQEASLADTETPALHSNQQPIKKTPQAKKEIMEGEDDNQDWISRQPSENVTLQVMVLSSKDSVRRFLKKYAEYSNSLKYYPLNINDQEKYVLIFGSFPSRAEAEKSKTNLPTEFKDSLEQTFKRIQNQSRRK